MFPANTWCFDLEIVKAILGKGETPEPGIQYCGGWGDHAGMGISVLVAANVATNEVRVFMGEGSLTPVPGGPTYEGLYSFAQLVDKADMLVGHNSRAFDAKVLLARGIIIPPRKHLDFYHEVKTALRTQFPKGYNLNALSTRCGGPAKTDDGALAPHLWQRGQRQRVIDYCKNDIQMTRAIAIYYSINGCVPDVKGEHLRLRSPTAVLSEG